VLVPLVVVPSPMDVPVLSLLLVALSLCAGIVLLFELTCKESVSFLLLLPVQLNNANSNASVYNNHFISKV
jgi:hypothetical protein